MTFYSYRCGKLEEGCIGAFKTRVPCGLGAAHVGVYVEEMWLMVRHEVLGLGEKSA